MDEEIVKKLELFPCNFCTKACLSLALLKIHEKENHLSEVVKKKQELIKQPTKASKGENKRKCTRTKKEITKIQSIIINNDNGTKITKKSLTTTTPTSNKDGNPISKPSSKSKKSNTTSIEDATPTGPVVDIDSGLESISNPSSENSIDSKEGPERNSKSEEVSAMEENLENLDDSTECTDDAEAGGSSTGLPPSSSRLMRNLAEKMRRDKLNMYISELSTLVPIVAQATKRMDKTSVLRLSANFLRIHHSLKPNKPKSETKISIPEGLEQTLSTTLLEALEGFMLIVSSSGKIVYISESVEKLLGHSQLDLMGQSLYTITHNGDTELLRHHLQPQPSSEFSSSESDTAHCSTDYVPRSPSYFGGKPEDALSGLASGERRSFYVRLSERSMARGDPARHVQVHLIGLLRPPENKIDKPAGKKKESGSSDEHLLVCVARPLRNKGIGELSLMEAVQDEYVTRHLPDGRIIYSDHRIAFVAGYLTEEVMGLSAFKFICEQDLPWATVANRQMFSSVEGQGYSVYRLRSKTGQLIHLRTRGFLEFNKTTQKVETFVCINTLLQSEDGDKELEKERERITPFLTFQQVTTTTTSGSGTSDLLAIEDVGDGESCFAQQLLSPSTGSPNCVEQPGTSASFQLSSLSPQPTSTIIKTTTTIFTSASQLPPHSHILSPCTMMPGSNSGGATIVELPPDDEVVELNFVESKKVGRKNKYRYIDEIVQEKRKKNYT